MLSTPQVLIVSSDVVQTDGALKMIGRMGWNAVTCSSLTDARAIVERQTFELILCNDDLPDCNLRGSIRVLATSTPTRGVPIIVLSHLADWDAYIKALRAGAFDYIVCPPEPVEAERILRLALDQNPTRRASYTAA